MNISDIAPISPEIPAPTSPEQQSTAGNFQNPSNRSTNYQDREEYAVANLTHAVSLTTEVRNPTNDTFLIVRGSIHQGDARFSNASGNQCTAMSMSSIIRASVQDPKFWFSTDIDEIINFGNELYNFSLSSGTELYLTPEEIYGFLQLGDDMLCSINIGDAVHGLLLRDTDQFQNLENFLKTLKTGRDCFGILTLGGYSFALHVFANELCLFNSHSTNQFGIIEADGTACFIITHNVDVIHAILSKYFPANDNDNQDSDNVSSYEFTRITIDFHMGNEDQINYYHDMHDLWNQDLRYDTPANGYRTCQYINKTFSAYPDEISDTTACNTSACYTSREHRQPCNDNDDNLNDNTCDGVRSIIPVGDCNDDVPNGLREDVVDTSSPDTVTVTTPYEFPETDRDLKYIVNMKYFFSKLKTAYKLHRISNKNCEFEDITLIETPKTVTGLKHYFTFKCTKCEGEMTVGNVPEANQKKMDINDAAVLGCLTIGIGFSQLQELLGIFNIKSSTNKVYQSSHDNVWKAVKDASIASMNRVAATERNASKKKIGDVPCIAVEVDGAYAKRSYINSRYDSSGCSVAVLGRVSKKILQLIVKQKTCIYCESAEREGRKPKKHDCSRNHGKNLSSTSMESAGVKEAFVKSVDRTGLIYNVMISDGDSSNHAAVLVANPYSPYNSQVQNYLCCKHLKRNLSTGLKTFVNTQLTGPGSTVQKNKLLSRCVIMIRTLEESVDAVQSLSDQTLGQKCSLLRKDIEILKYHLLGNHWNCHNTLFTCHGTHQKGKENDNIYDDLVSRNVYLGYSKIYQRAISHVESLILGFHTNNAESFNNLVAKTNGGKRIKNTHKRSYKTRCHIACIQHNEGINIPYICKSLGVSCPGVGWNVQSKRLVATIQKNIRNMDKDRKSRKNYPKNATQDKYYGLNAIQPDKSPAEFERLKKEFLDEMKQYQKNRVQIEIDTREQSKSDLWMSIRRKLVTASNAHGIVRRRPATSCRNSVSAIVYPRYVNTSATMYGQDHEIETKELLRAEGYTIQDCGLFLDPVNIGIAASPDFLVEIDGHLVTGEIKSLAAARNVRAIEAMKDAKLHKTAVNFKWVEDNLDGEPQAKKKKKGPKKQKLPNDPELRLNPVLKKTSTYYTQIQMQIHCTGAHGGILVISTDVDYCIIMVPKDQEFIDIAIREILRFYDEAIIPEIIDSRLLRNMEIREPDFILRAQEDARKKKEMKEADPKKHAKKKTKQAITKYVQDDSQLQVTEDMEDSHDRLEEEEIFENELLDIFGNPVIRDQFLRDCEYFSEAVGSDLDDQSVISDASLDSQIYSNGDYEPDYDEVTEACQLSVQSVEHAESDGASTISNIISYKSGDEESS